MMVIFMKKTKSKTNMRFILLSLIFILILIFQNCSEFSTQQNIIANGIEFSSTGGIDLVPSTDQYDDTCYDNPKYNTCIYYKNSYVSKNIYGVKLTGIQPGAYLENSKFQILTANFKRFNLLTDSLKPRDDQDGEFHFGQLQSYYWLERSQEYLSKRFHGLPSDSEVLKIYVDDLISGFSPADKSISLAYKNKLNNDALSSELLIYFYGIANAWFAANVSQWNSDLSSKHLDCHGQSFACCKTELGCAKAILQSAGDYFVNLMFPKNSALGDSQSDKGFTHCGLIHDAQQMLQQDFTKVFNSCETQGFKGEIHLLGSYYAGLWLSLRKKLQDQKLDAATKSLQDLDFLFMEHLKILQPDDDFKSILIKIKQIDTEKTNSKLYPLIQNEFLTHGF